VFVNMSRVNEKNPKDNSDDDDNVHYAEEEYQDEHDDYNDPVPEKEPQPRQFKYSTANMNEDSKWKKYCLIFLTFLLMILFMVALSMLMQHFFFSDTSDNKPQTIERDMNGTFPKEKMEVNQACSRATLESDEGERCTEVCDPQFFVCCDPFKEFDVNATETDAMRENITEAKNLTNCTLDQELVGCMNYAKCQAIGTHNGKQVEPAPAILSVVCSKAHLEKDPVSCQELCKPVRCCYSAGNDRCIADDFDICLDYAPCQNLRHGLTLEIAPEDLDSKCLQQQPECNQACKKAECCNDPESTCLQSNFVACLTYAPCTGVTRTTIQIPPIYTKLEKPSDELQSACGAYHDLMAMPAAVRPATHSCQELCVAAACCYANNPTDNCFFEDPLGCMAYDQQCQVL